MRKLIIVIFLTAIFPLSLASVYGADLKDGFFDIQWKTNLSQKAGFKKVGENLNVSYYTNPERIYTIDDLKIQDVLYGCYADRFFAVYINIETIEIFAQLKRRINNKYGLPKIKMSAASKRTTYQWKDNKTKIKLKTYEDKNNMRMAFYYTPLSRKVNEAQQEAFHENYSKPLFPLAKTEMQNAIDLKELMRDSLGPQ